jgi:hypothetical protein
VGERVDGSDAVENGDDAQHQFGDRSYLLPIRPRLISGTGRGDYAETPDTEEPTESLHLVPGFAVVLMLPAGEKDRRNRKQYACDEDQTWEQIAGT